MSSAAVAKIGFQGLKAGKRIVVAGFNNLMGTMMVRFLPYSVILPMVRKMMQPKEG